MRIGSGPAGRCVGLAAQQYWLDFDHSWRRLGAGVVGLTVIVVAFSRLYLDVHWLADVAGGFALGLAYLLLTIWLVESLSRRRAQ